MASNTSTTGGGGGVQVEGRALVHGAPWEGELGCLPSVYVACMPLPACTDTFLPPPFLLRTHTRTHAEMVQAWDPESMLAVEASTPPLDACTGRTVTVAAFADALKRALEEEQGSGSSSSRIEEAAVRAPSCGGGSGAGWDGMSFDAAASSEYFAEYMEELSLSPSPFCSGHHSSGSGRAGTATPDIFALPPRATTAAAAGSEDESDELHSLAGGLPPTPPALLVPTASHQRVLVRFGGEDSSSSSIGEATKGAKLYIGPLACDASVWTAWGLHPAAWASFSRRVNADPSDVDGHVQALLQAARAAGLEEEEGEGGAMVLTLPAGSRPAAVSLSMRVGGGGSLVW